MKQADQIRRFVLDEYISPAQSSGRSEITIRAGDIHKRMGLHSAMPAVCSALGSGKFLELASVSLRHRAGPTNGSNVYFTFNLTPKIVPLARVKKAKSRVSERNTEPEETVDLKNALVLVSCVKSKLDYAAPARDLYISHWFSLARDQVELGNADWFILSSRYGLIEPNQIIAPYEFTLNSLGVAERRAWAADVLARLLPIAKNYRQVVIFAGQRYREFLVGPLKDLGLDVTVPMEGLRLGEQLSWLGHHGLVRPGSKKNESKGEKR